MPGKSPYDIDLHAEETAELPPRARKYTLPYFQVLRARMILLAADGWRNDQIAEQWSPSGASASSSGGSRGWATATARAGFGFSRPEVVVEVKVLAWELPSTHGAPLARWSRAELASAPRSSPTASATSRATAQETGLTVACRCGANTLPNSVPAVPRRRRRGVPPGTASKPERFETSAKPTRRRASDARAAGTSSALVGRVGQLRVRVAFGRCSSAPAGCGPRQAQRHRFAVRLRNGLNGVRPAGAGPSMSARGSTSAPQSGHLAGNGSRTSTANGVLQPRHSAATVSRRWADAAGKCAPNSRRALICPPPGARSRPSPTSAPASSSTSPAGNALRSDSSGARTPRLNRRQHRSARLVGHRQQKGRRDLGRTNPP